MPKIRTTIPEVEQSVTRPILIDIIKQIQDITKIPHDTKILWPGDIQRMQIAGTSIDENTRRAEYLSGHFLHIEVTEDYDHDAISSTGDGMREYQPIFADPALDFYITPSYVPINVVINFKYRTSSKTEALRWRDDIRMRASEMREMFMHRIHYHYTVPRGYLDLIVAIHTSREATAGYNQSFEAYFKSNASPRFTEIGNQSGTNSELGVSEVQNRIIGMFDFQGVPDKIERDSDNISWTISCIYKFSYERPAMLNVNYPIMVHNTPLPNKFIIFNQDSYDLDAKDSYYANSLNALHVFEAQDQWANKVDVKPFIKIPKYDEFIPESIKPGTATSLVALCTIDPDLRNILNLNELGDVSLDADILEFMAKSEYPYMTKEYGSILQVELYRFKYLVDAKELECDTALNVRSLVDLDLRKNYRIRVGIVTDLTKLDNNAIERLKQYPKAFIKIIGAINEVLRKFPGMLELSKVGFVTTQNFNTIYKILTGMIYSGTSNKYTTGNAGVSGITNGVFISSNSAQSTNRYDPMNIFRDIPPSTLEDIRNNTIRQNTVMSTYIVVGAKG